MLIRNRIQLEPHQIGTKGQIKQSDVNIVYFFEQSDTQRRYVDFNRGFKG